MNKDFIYDFLYQELINLCESVVKYNPKKIIIDPDCVIRYLKNNNKSKKEIDEYLYLLSKNLTLEINNVI